MSAPTPTNLPLSYIMAYTGDELVALAAAFIPILLSFVGLRFYSRFLSKTRLGWDDYLVLISLCLQIGECALAICFVQYGGVGHHIEAWLEVDPSVAITYYKYLLAVSFYYFFCVAWPKLAILALYLRLFTLKPYRVTVYVLIAIVSLTGIICPIMSLNLCHPFEYNWNRTIAGTCVNEQAFYQWGSLPNIITDVVMLMIPIPIVWNLHTSLKLKLGLTVAFTTGSLGLATSIVRFASFFQGSAVEDGTWSSVQLMIWTIVEPSVYLIAACLPTYRPIFMHLLGNTSLLSKSGTKGSQSGYGNGQSLRSNNNFKPTHLATTYRYDTSKEGSEAGSYCDDIGLVKMGEKRSGDNFNTGNIHVQNRYDVSVSRV